MVGKSNKKRRKPRGTLGLRKKRPHVPIKLTGQVQRKKPLKFNYNHWSIRTYKFKVLPFFVY